MHEILDPKTELLVAIGAAAAAKSQQFMAQFIDDTTNGAAGLAAGAQDEAEEAGGCGCR